MHVADFDGDGRDDLLIAGTDRFGVLQTGQKGQRLKTIASYESKRNEAKLADLAVGDVNGDGVPDVVFVDIGEQSLEIASFAGDKDLVPAITFKIFERKTFRNVGDIDRAPRHGHRRRRRRRPRRHRPHRPRSRAGLSPGPRASPAEARREAGRLPIGQVGGRVRQPGLRLKSRDPTSPDRGTAAACRPCRRPDDAQADLTQPPLPIITIGGVPPLVTLSRPR